MPLLKMRQKPMPPKSVILKMLQKPAPRKSVILSEASSSFIARSEVEGSAVPLSDHNAHSLLDAC